MPSGLKGGKRLCSLQFSNKMTDGICKDMPPVSMLNSLAASDQRATSISANFSVFVEYLQAVPQ